jgi:hypothetical protein
MPARKGTKISEAKRKAAAAKKRAKSSPKTLPANRITPEEGERLFAYWCEIHDTTGFSGLARKSKRTRSTLRDYAKRHKWEVRYLQISKVVSDSTDNQVANRHVEKIKMATGLANSALGGLYKYDPADKNPDISKRLMILKVTPTISDAVRAMTYEDNLRERFPDTGDQATSTLSKEQVATSVAVLTTLQTMSGALEALGTLIVEKAKRLVKKEDDARKQTDAPAAG